jgi:acetylornithine/succinyldiaminopimelate/putrescine aminotransferase
MQTRQALIRTSDVLTGHLSPERAIDWDMRYGNLDLIRAMRSLDMAGPYMAVSPWALEDEQGTRRINATGYAALPFGERPPDLVAFLHEYLDRDQSMGLPQQTASTWRAALQHNLIALLAAQAPSHADSEVFLSNSGAEAVEAAIKFVRAGRPQARYLINFTGAYHGLTWMALSLTPSHDYQDLFRPLLPDIVTVPFGDSDAVREIVAGLGPENVAGVIVEPIQGDAGVIIPPPGFLQELGELCRAHGILVVADEIQTGLGRTGHLFESLAQGLEPDVITLGKSLSGGMVPIGVTIARKSLCRSALSGLGCGRTSSTYGGNSLAAAVALKSLEMIVEGDLPGRARTLGTRGLARLQAIHARYPHLLTTVRGAGMLFALQFEPVIPPEWATSQAEMIGEFSATLGLRVLHDAGVEACLAVTSRRNVRLTPALNMPEELFEEMWNRVERAAATNPAAWRMLIHAHLHTLVGLAGLAHRT